MDDQNWNKDEEKKDGMPVEGGNAAPDMNTGEMPEKTGDDAMPDENKPKDPAEGSDSTKTW
jgi:hypothetical protein